MDEPIVANAACATVLSARIPAALNHSLLKIFPKILKNLKVSDKKTLFVTAGADKVVYLSARNIERVQVMPANALNTYKVLNADVMVVSESALAVIEGNLTK